MDPRPLIPAASPTMPASAAAGENTRNAPLKESVLMFFAAVGCTICYTSVLSNLVHYTLTMGAQSYLFLNLTIYAPMLPITISQTIWDVKFDREAGTSSAYSFRGSLGFLISFICLLLMGLPFADQLIPLLIISLFLGLASAILHGMLKQIASFIYPGCGRLAVAVAAGMQASALPVLCVSLATGFGSDTPSDGDGHKQIHFYFSIAGLLLFCWGCFQVLITYSEGVRRSMQRQDSLLLVEEDEEIIEPIIIVSIRDDDHLEPDHPPIFQAMSENKELSTLILWKKSQWACFVIMITVASSMSVASWLNHVKSQKPENKSFAQVLFYTRLLGDLLGRPATLYQKSRSTPISISKLLGIACVRLSFVPVFFLYTATNIIPKWDVAAVGGIFIFAFTSGYLTTLAYQTAPFLLTRNSEERQRNLTRQTGIMNVCFSTSILLGFCLTFAIDSAVSV